MNVSGHIPFQNVISTINSRNVEDNESNDVKRTKRALCFETKEKDAYPQRLSKKELKEMAWYVNNTYIHYSGNCALLSACLHYNIHHRQNVLSAKNTDSPTVGLDRTVVDEVIFGEVLEQSYCFYSIDEVEEEILKRYNINSQDSFIIKTENYIIPIIGEYGHNFNAVVVREDDDKEPFVQFIDAWKTSNILPTSEELKKHFPSSAQFYIRAYEEDA